MAQDNQSIEQKYDEVYKAFLDSDDDSTFTKTDVKQIIEAHKYKEFMENYRKVKQRKPKRKRNIIVSAKSFGKDILSVEFFVHLFLTYLFYVGAFVLITSFIYPNLLTDKPSVFFLALAFTLVDRIVRPFIFFFDLVSFTFHKIGLFTLGLFTLVFFILGNILNGQGITISFEKSIIVAIIVLLIAFVVDYINKQSLFKTNFTSEDLGSEQDE